MSHARRATRVIWSEWTDGLYIGCDLWQNSRLVSKKKNKTAVVFWSVFVFSYTLHSGWLLSVIIQIMRQIIQCYRQNSEDWTSDHNEFRFSELRKTHVIRPCPTLPIHLRRPFENDGAFEQSIPPPIMDCTHAALAQQLTLMQVTSSELLGGTSYRYLLLLNRWRDMPSATGISHSQQTALRRMQRRPEISFCFCNPLHEDCNLNMPFSDSVMACFNLLCLWVRPASQASCRAWPGGEIGFGNWLENALKEMDVAPNWTHGWHQVSAEGGPWLDRTTWQSSSINRVQRHPIDIRGNQGAHAIAGDLHLSFFTCFACTH